MRKYGKQLMKQLPDATTELLKKLCMDWIPKNMDLSNMSMGPFVCLFVCLFVCCCLFISLV